MLTITVRKEDFNDETNKFITEEFVLELEHSLVALSKWEEKHKKAYLGPGEKTDEEAHDYVRCMLLTPDVPPDVLRRLSSENIQTITDYIQDKMTATWFNEIEPEAKNKSEVITAELIYYWMATLQIPWEAQHWHLNKLFTLIKIFGAKNGKPKKMSRSEMLRRREHLNEQRMREEGHQG